MVDAVMHIGDRWVRTDAMMKVMEWFHHNSACSITGKIKRLVCEGGWEWTPVEEALEAAGL